MLCLIDHQNDDRVCFNLCEEPVLLCWGMCVVNFNFNFFVGMVKIEIVMCCVWCGGEMYIYIL